MRLRWPITREPRRELREGAYTDAIIDRIIARAGGDGDAPARATGALEACASIVARSFAAAEVEAPDIIAAALGPGCLAMIGRAMIRQGEIVLSLDVRDGRLMLSPAAFWDVDGEHEPESWLYRVNLSGPDTVTTLKRLPAASVVHVRYMVDPDAPWRGVGPLQSAAIAGRLSAETVQALADEAGGPRGSLLPVPKDGNDPTVEPLKADIRTLAGKVALVESQVSGQWDNAQTGRAVSREYEPRRLGANPPAALISQAELASREVCAACGVPWSLFIDGQGTGQRESYRRLLHGTIVPLGEIAAEELSAKLETPVRLNFDRLFAADLSGRARAFQSLVNGGMDVAKAAALAGLMEAEG